VNRDDWFAEFHPLRFPFWLQTRHKFRKVTGHKQIPALLKELEALAPPRSEVVKRRKVS
jgi:hypothetical protein